MVENAAKRNYKHGHARREKQSSTYFIWRGMKRRCSNPQEPYYKDYGGRGIKVCDRWLKFKNFLADMGERPEGKSLDRVDNNGNYEPSNCRWATSQEQNGNCRRNRRIEFRGETRIAKEWAMVLGIGYDTLLYRLKTWSIEKALTQPVRK